MKTLESKLRYIAQKIGGAGSWSKDEISIYKKLLKDTRNPEVFAPDLMAAGELVTEGKFHQAYLLLESVLEEAAEDPFIFIHVKRFVLGTLQPKLMDLFITDIMNPQIEGLYRFCHNMG